MSFFGLPLGDDAETNAQDARLTVRTFRIAGVLKDEVESNGPGRQAHFRGLMPAARLYIPLATARELSHQYRDPLNEVALQLVPERLLADGRVLISTLGTGVVSGQAQNVLALYDPANQQLLDVTVPALP